MFLPCALLPTYYLYGWCKKVVVVVVRAAMSSMCAGRATARPCTSRATSAQTRWFTRASARASTVARRTPRPSIRWCTSKRPRSNSRKEGNTSRSAKGHLTTPTPTRYSTNILGERDSSARSVERRWLTDYLAFRTPLFMGSSLPFLTRKRSTRFPQVVHPPPTRTKNTPCLFLACACKY